MKQNYEVLRLIRQNMGCHIIMDCVQGEILGNYIIQNPNIQKEKFFSWMIQLTRDMEAIQMTRGLPEYRFLNPFCIVIKEDGTLALLNLKEKVNQQRVDKLFEDSVMKMFLPEDGTYSDIYSFGKTMQFILAKTNISPKLSREEEKKLSKIILWCLTDNSKIKYQNFQEIITDISSVSNISSQSSNSNNSNKRRFVLLAVAILLSLILVK